MRTVNGLAEMQTLVGQELGVSDWHLVTQEEVDLFAKATHDHQWIHVDPERCKRESPFGGPIAHGYYTIALAPALLAQVLDGDGRAHGRELRAQQDAAAEPGAGRVTRARCARRSPATKPIAGGASVTIGLELRGRGSGEAGVRRRGDLPLLRVSVARRHYRNAGSTRSRKSASASRSNGARSARMTRSAPASR